MSTALSYTASTQLPESTQHLVVVGHEDALRSDTVSAALPEVARPLWSRMLDTLSAGDAGASATTFLDGDGPERLSVALLPSICSRHNSPAHPHAATALLVDLLGGEGDAAVWLALDSSDHAMAQGCAVARALPQYSRKTGKDDEGRTVHVGFLTDGDVDAETIGATAAYVRTAARLVDTPPNELHTDAFVDEAKALAAELDVDIMIKRGETLRDEGFGGIWNVGMASEHPPALVVLTHEPEGAEKTICWVGKGIVYDTGGLSIKTKNGMPGMKTDMGGAAAVFGAFGAAVASGFPHRLHAILCIAENSVGSRSFRPDDVITLYSGKTVEINNTDAEGRLCLGDGVAYASKHLDPDVIVDLATLTGAQLIATGQRHAATYCNDDDLEAQAISVGKRTGDLLHPLPYCPEFFRAEFKSPVADMKNSVKDRMNAQSSCAGQFVGNHLVDYDKLWLHIDIAGPSTQSGERSTGFGVALLPALFG